MILGSLPKKGEKKDKKISKTIQIDDRMYDKLEYLAKNIYDTSINKIVETAINYLIEHENINLYTVDYSVRYHSRTYLIEKSTLDGLNRLMTKYPNLSLYALVNIAVHNVLEEETEHLKGFDD